MEKKIKTIFDSRYDLFITDIIRIRHQKGITQRDLVVKSGYDSCFVGRTETRDRRLDFIETIDYMKHLGLTKTEIAAKMAEWVEAFA